MKHTATRSAFGRRWSILRPRRQTGIRLDRQQRQEAAELSQIPTGSGTKGQDTAAAAEEAAAVSRPAPVKFAEIWKNAHLCVMEPSVDAGWHSQHSRVRAALQTLAPDLRRICSPGMTFEG